MLGPQDSRWENGVYHMALDLSGYPENPPVILALSESGSFERNMPPCIHGISHYHPYDWTPGTKISSILDTLQMYFSVEDPVMRGGVGIIKQFDNKKIAAAKEKCGSFKCSQCGMDHAKLKLRYK